MESTTPLCLPLNWRPISSANQYLTRASSTKHTAKAEESDLLKAIRATLAGSRGDSDDTIHSTFYPETEDTPGDEELSWDAHTVVLSSGGIIRKKFSFELEREPVQWACIAYFEQPSACTSGSSLRPGHYTYHNPDKSTPDTNQPQRPTFGPFARAFQVQKREHEPGTYIRALYVFLRSIGKIFLFGDIDYTFCLPFIVRRAWSLHPHGVMIQRVVDAEELAESKASEEFLLPTIFTFSNPFAEPAAVCSATKIVGGFHQVPASLKDDQRSTNFVDAEEHIVWVSQRSYDLSDRLVVTVNPSTCQLSLWRYALVNPNHGKDDATSHERPRPRTKAHKRASMTGGTPVHRRHASAAETSTLANGLSNQAADSSSLGTLPGMPPSLSATATMAALMGGASTDIHRPGRHSTSNIDLSVTMDQLALGARVEGERTPEAVDTGKMTPAYWMERLYSQEISQVDASALEDISAVLFDQRWDGSDNRSLLSVCLPKADTLLIFRIIKHDDHTFTAAPHARLSAYATEPIRATRDTVRDLLVLRRDGSLVVLTHGLYEVPLRFRLPERVNDAATVDISDSPNSTSQDPLVGRIVAIKDASDSSVTIVFSDSSRIRATINLMPRDPTARQCLLMLAMVLPADTSFDLHRRFLSKWSLQNFSTADDVEFQAFALSLYEVLQLDPPDKGAVTAPSQGDPWSLLAGSSSFSRFREDPVLQKLQLPSSISSIRSRRVTRQPHNLLAPVLNALHFVAEDMRCLIYRHMALLKLAPVICKLALVVRPEWADYWKRNCPDAIDVWPSPAATAALHVDDRLPVWPPDITAILYNRMNTPEWNYPWLESRAFAQHFKINASFAYGRTEPLSRLHKLTAVYACLADTKVSDSRKRAENALHMLVKTQIGLDVLRYLPIGMAAPLREAARTCQLTPGGDWPISAYLLIGRNDLAEVLSSPDPLHSCGYRSFRDRASSSTPRKTIREQIEESCKTTGATGAVTGVELDLKDFTQIRFGQDGRMEEAARMLCSSTVPTIKAVERPDLTEHDQAKENQHQVVRMAERTLALPLGRALFTFGSVPTVTREAYAIPKLEFSVRLQPHNLLITPELGKVPIECLSWGEFHNGVAAGLRISPQSNAVESTWIKFNRPSDLTPEHAGFLFALGLTGHLREMLTWHTFGYLTPKHELTSIGVLLGLSAANAGGSNPHVTKLLAVHTPALLPTPTVDLNVPLITQAAGLIGIGLLYMGTKNRRMAEVCLGEISRKDLYQPDLSNEYREAYTLAAGLACGMVMLGKGSSIPADLHSLERLRVLIHGEGRAWVNGQETRPSFDINLTSPTATITLGLMYLRTERQDVADILTIPDTLLALDSIQPSFLLLRTLARSLIMWDKIAPNQNWLSAQIPPNIDAAMSRRFNGKPVDDAYELAYYNILAGCCFAIALKFAGTAREEAYLLIIHYYDMFSQLTYTNSPAFDHRIKRSAIRDGLNLISISLNMVMAGTGEINCMRRLRYAYGMYSQPIRYGSFVATHMSMGLLFLGGGRYTLGTSDAAIACMVAAFFPRYAQISSDNKSYLQALRHLWVLAVEPRCLIARDVDTKEVVYLPVKIKVKEGDNACTTQLISPTLIPDLDKLLSIRVDTPRYWPFFLDIARHPHHKESLLRSQTLFVKRRTAFLSYMEDPKGSRSLFVRSGSSMGDAAVLDFPQLTDLKTHPANDLHHFISSFSNDTLFLAFADRFCRDDGETIQEQLLHSYCHASLLDSILQDKRQTIQSHLTIFRYRTMSTKSQYFNLRAQDLRFATDFYNKIYDRRFSGRTENNFHQPLVRENTLSGALHALDTQLDAIRDMPVFRTILGHYVRGASMPAYPAGSAEHEAVVYLSWYLQRNSVPAATLLVVLKRFAQEAHVQCLRLPPPQGTDDSGVLDQGLKEVVQATGTQMATALGSGWAVRSLDDVLVAWMASG